jgi:hypothetical protein
VDEAALAAFSAGAETRSTEVPVTSKRERATESVLLRLTPTQIELINFVFEHTNIKSRQKLIESILLPELERRAEMIRNDMK